MKYRYLVCLAFLIYHFELVAQVAPKKAKASIPTYKTFAEQKTTYGFHKTRTKTYKIRKIPPSYISYGEPQEFLSRPNPSASAESGPYYSGAVKCSGNTFSGVDRAQAKTHEVAGPPQSFATVDDFLDSGLFIPDDQMINHDPVITKSSESPRVTEEQINVTINKAYIYGIYREQDNDFHMIVGNGQTGAGMRIFNAEVSGLPGDENDSLLITVRNKILNRFGDIACQDGAFKPVSSFIPITITGSIFFDVDHRAGLVGFGVYKPTTAWEIHPITDIEFLDE